MMERAFNINPPLYGMEKLIFKLVNIRFENEMETNVFSHKNNKSLAETVTHKRYRKLKDRVYSDYSESLEISLGKFLLDCKRSGDPFYLDFLNKCGDLAYSKFWIDDEYFINQKGVYAYFEGEELKYIGRCKDTLKKRVNQGYGKIHPKNCYIDGQATNCRINALVSEKTDEITFWLCAIESIDHIEAIERHLIQQYLPPWNIQK
ncbi:MAG: hypothetical protein JKY34_02980 [Kordiimonadaceae bacterium]|nr:hypothetical protein [Kordiimonadaceae bacterium]